MNKNKYELFEKHVGETPLEALGRFRLEKPEYADETLSYAGRLDPMAEGELLVLIGEENKERKKYLGLEKEYEFEVLFGFATDTYDLLGIVSETARPRMIARGDMSAVVAALLGKRVQQYPVFSSKTVGGVPLHAHARAGTLEDIEIPERIVEIKTVELVAQTTISSFDLLKEIEQRIAQVKGDFRQEKSVKRWSDMLGLTQYEYPLFRFKAHVSSGTYIRSLAYEMGKKLGQPSLAFSIRRTKIFV